MISSKEEYTYSKFNVIDGVYNAKILYLQPFSLCVFDPFSLFTKVSAKYSDKFGTGQDLGEDVFQKNSGEKVWYSSLIEQYESELSGDPGDMKIEIFINDKKVAVLSQS